MGKRLYLANGFFAGTLTEKEKIEARNNPIVMREVKSIENKKRIKSKKKRKAVKNG